MTKKTEFISSSDQLALIMTAAQIRKEADERLDNKTLIEHNGLILPVTATRKNAWDIYERPLQVEVEPDTWVTFKALVFEGLTEPKGPLVDNFACQGLMYYAIKAFKQWHQRTQELSYEDDPDVLYDFGNMFKTTALMYCVDPEYMHQYWPVVKKAFKTMFGWDLPPPIVRGVGKQSFKYAE